MTSQFIAMAFHVMSQVFDYPLLLKLPGFQASQGARGGRAGGWKGEGGCEEFLDGMFPEAEYAFCTPPQPCTPAFSFLLNSSPHFFSSPPSLQATYKQSCQLPGWTAPTEAHCVGEGLGA